jgi:hypothetical protein
MAKKNIPIKQNRALMGTAVAGLVVAIFSGFFGYSLASQKYGSNKTPTQNTPGYITADAARDQVDNFYRQYLHPRKGAPEESRKAFVSTYGDKNLVFYSNYYQHGFDPIVCSSIMPASVTAMNVQPGAGAIVKAEAKYPDDSTANITLTLVLNSEGFRIDSITCPGVKGNLLP